MTPSKRLLWKLTATTLLGAVFVSAEAPRLAVVISIDQFRADYLDRFDSFFGAGGFRRFKAEGLVFSDCHVKHAFTVTAPGHATLLTGTSARDHGIISNEWMEPDTLVRHTSVEDKTHPLVGQSKVNAAPVLSVLSQGSEGASPFRLRADTVGDTLKSAYGSETKVLAVSNKDRAAILMGGHHPDAAYWLEGENFVTSTYYLPTPVLPTWVEAFNGEKRVRANFGKSWVRLLDVADYDRVQGPDRAPGEDDRLGLGIVFPHVVTGGLVAPGEAFYEAYRLTPFSTDLLEVFAEKAVEAEQLGTHAHTDLLCVSFSQVDYAGHSYGPDSHEVMDSVIRMDNALARFFAFLDEKVGKGNYVVTLSADHGVTPLPEHTPATTPPGSRFYGKELDASIEAELTSRYGALPKGDRWVSRDAFGYRLRPSALAAHPGMNRAEAAIVVRDLTKAHAQVATAFTAADLEGDDPDSDSLRARVRLSYVPALSPDVVYVLKPYVVAMGAGSNAGTTHGMPYDCDDHIPLLFLGAGVPHDRRTDRVYSIDLAPTLSGLLGIAPPSSAKGKKLF